MDRGEWLKTYTLFGVLALAAYLGPAIGVNRAAPITLFVLFLWMFLRRGADAR